MHGIFVQFQNHSRSGFPRLQDATGGYMRQNMQWKAASHDVVMLGQWENIMAGVRIG
jgi:hypothetical protein